MSSLNDICYEQIIENYCYALFGDFKLVIDKDTGFFNATKLCKNGGKSFKHWLENKKSKELIQYLSSSRNSGRQEIIYEVRKGTDRNAINGTYVVKDLITHIACWISKEFYVKVNNIVINYYSKKFNENYKNNEEKLKRKLYDIESKMKIIKIENEKFKDDIAPKTSVPSKLNMLAIIKKNKEDSDYPYYVIRCQKGLYNKTIKDLKIRYPNLTIIHEIKYNPNAINLFNRIKENIPYIDCKFNHLKVDDFEKFKHDIDELIPFIHLY